MQLERVLKGVPKYLREGWIAQSMRSRGRQQLTLVVGNYSIEIIYKFGVAKILTLRDFSASKSVWRERNYEIKQQKNTKKTFKIVLRIG